MEANHILTLYVTYYLSRYDKLGLKKLGYKNWTVAFKDIANRLDVNEHSVQNWRDEFDPIHGFRKGWHQRNMSPSRIRIVKALENLEEETIRNLVLEILSSKNISNQNIEELIRISSENEIETEFEFIPRGITGNNAEQYFIKHHTEFKELISGKLIDTRSLGTGYDFMIEGKTTNYIEVKGLSSFKGGILLTDKEWSMANKYKTKYFIILISNLDENPNVKIIQNPSKILTPKKSISTSIVINWNVSSTQIHHLKNI